MASLKTKTIGVLTFLLIVATVGVGVVGKPPRWSVVEEVGTHLPALPRDVVTAFTRCHSEPTCEPAVVAENKTVTIALSPVRSLQGLWSGKDAQFSWTHGRVRADTSSDSWGKVLFGQGKIPTESARPTIRVPIPDIPARDLHRSLAATATLTVEYPVRQGDGFVNVTGYKTRHLHMIVVTADEMQVLSSHAHRPRTARDWVLPILILADIFGVLALLGSASNDSDARKARRYSGVSAA